MSRGEEIAVVGLAVTFAGSLCASRYWDNVLGSRVSLREAPAERISRQFFSDAMPDGLRLRTRRGGFLDAALRIDPARYGVMPARASAMEPEQLVALKLSDDALRDAGVSEAAQLRKRRGGVIFGRSNVSGPGRLRLEQTLRGACDLRESLLRFAGGLGARKIEEIVARYRSHYQATSRRGDAEALIPNLVASRVAKRFNLDGPTYTVDAACASSLLAVEQSCEMLAARKVDLMLCGGIHVWQDESLWWAFESLGAMSKSGSPMPFDKAADGLVLGEGAAVFVLKRAEDARRDGDRPYGLIAGWGSSSDGRDAGTLAPSEDGQLCALERAWRSSGLDPAEIGYLEAHATGTPIGDATELAGLRRFFGPPGSAAALRPGIGAVKGLIGHTLAAAGGAGLAKVLLALRRGYKPPVGNLVEACDALRETRFHPYVTPQEWDGPRLAAVSAFGFGGVNAHVVVRGIDSQAARCRASTPGVERVAAATSQSLAARLRARERGGVGAFRAVLRAGDEKKRQMAAKAAEAGRSARRSRAGVSVVVDPLIRAGGKVAFLFPGLDAVRTSGSAADSAGETPVARGIGVVADGIRLWQSLVDSGLRPDVVAGHSIGEWVAMVAAGVVEESVARRILERVTQGYFEFPAVSYVVAACPLDVAEAVAKDCPGIEVSHDNCPTQTVLCGPEESATLAVDKLRRSGVPCWRLPFATGFHTSYLAPGLSRHRETVRLLEIAPPVVPIWSATTAAPFSEGEDVRQLLIDQVLCRVRFRELVQRLYSVANVRVFVQIGAGGLSGFVEDTLKGAAVLSFSTADAGASPAEQIEWTRELLWSEGFEESEDVASHDVEGWLGTTSVELGVATFADALGSPPDDAADSLDWDVSLVALPELSDHAFVRQPPGWPDVSDTDPVMPLSGILEMVLMTFNRSNLGRRVSEVRDLSATKWMRVAPPCRVASSVTPIVAGREYKIALGDFAQARVVPVNGAQPERPWAIPAHARPCPLQPRDVYEQRWLFHGPRYQTMVAVDGVWSEGVAGRVRCDAARGATLDGAAQLVGLWVMLHTAVDRLTIPVRIRRARFGAASPEPGDIVECVAKIVGMTERIVVADIQLRVDDRVWLTVNGWENRRLRLDERTWNVMRWPGRYTLARILSAGVALEDLAFRVPAIEEHVLRQYFGRLERDALIQRGEVDWDEVARRIAVKDAARDLLWTSSAEEIFPIEVACARAGDRGYDVVWRRRRLQVALVDTPLGCVAVCGVAGWPEAGFAPAGDCNVLAPARTAGDECAIEEGTLELGSGTLWWRRAESQSWSRSDG